MWFQTSYDDSSGKIAATLKDDEDRKEDIEIVSFKDADGPLIDSFEDNVKIQDSIPTVSTEYEPKIPYIFRYTEAIIFRTLPDSMWVNVENIPKRYAHILAFMNFFAFLIGTLYFFISAYNNEIGSSFVSTDPTAGICLNNLLQVDVNMLVSVNNGSRGVWSTLNDYQINTTAYNFKFAGYSGIVLHYDFHKTKS
jgi:hypothetical protein